MTVMENKIDLTRVGYMTPGERIRLGRQRLGLTQTEMGKEVGVSQAYVSKWETGGELPNPRRYAALLSALHMEAAAELVRLLYGLDYLSTASPRIDKKRSGRLTP